MSLLATTTTELAHRVRVVHAATGAPIPLVRVQADRLGWGWAARVIGGEAIVTRRGAAAAPPQHLDLEPASGAHLATLALPAPQPGQLPGTVRVVLASADLSVAIPPVPMSLLIDLVDDGTGAPRTGRAVTLRPSAGAQIALPETSTPGTYASPPTVWTSAFVPGELRVGGVTVRRVTPDFTHVQTRIRVVDPT